MLKDTGAKAGRPDFVAAVRAAGVGVMVEEVVDQVGGEQRPLVPGVAWLSASGTGRLLGGECLGRLDDVRGRRLGGGRGILAGRGQLLLEACHGGLQSLDLAVLGIDLHLQALTSRTGGGCLSCHALVLWHPCLPVYLGRERRRRDKPYRPPPWSTRPTCGWWMWSRGGTGTAAAPALLPPLPPPQRIRPCTAPPPESVRPRA